MKTRYAAWLQIEQASDVESAAKLENPRRCLLATFETEEEAKAFSMELSRKGSPRATGEEDAANSMKTSDQFTPG